MTKPMIIKTLSLSTSPISGVCKRPALHDEQGNIMPLIYFQKPKWMPKDNFDTILDNIFDSMTIPTIVIRGNNPWA